jgi:hypothetical protein
MHRFRRKIAVLTFIVVIWFFLIVLVDYYNSYTQYNQFLIHNTIKELISVIQFLSRGHMTNFDKNFHRILQKGFPDWEERIQYETKQQELYKSAQTKLNIYNLKLCFLEELLSSK